MSFYEILNKLCMLLNKETLDRKQGDDKLKHDIDTEASARETADNELRELIRTSIGGVTESQLNEEITNRQNADNTLQTNIYKEAQAREQGDTALQQKINAEASTREQADQEIREGVSDKISELKSDLTLLESSETSILTSAEGYVLKNGYYDKHGIYHESNSFSNAFVNIDGITQFTIHSDNTTNAIVVNYVDYDKKFVSNLLDWSTAENTIVNSTDIPSEAKYISISSNYLYDANISVITKRKTIRGELESVKSFANAILPLNKEVFGYSRSIPVAKSEGYAPSNGWVDAGGIIKQGGYCHGYVDFYGNGFQINADAGVIVVNYVDENKAHLSNLVSWNNQAETIVEKENIPNGAKYICISCANSKASTTIVSVKQDGLRKHFETEIEDVRSSVVSSAFNQYHNDASYAYSLSEGYPFIKCLFLDCGRKYFSVTNIKALIDEMASVNLNTLQLYFSDHKGFRFGLDDMSIVVNGVGYDLSIALGDGDSPSDGSNKWLTQSEMDEIISYANGKNIDIIPAFDMPGHMNAIINKFPQFANITSASTVTFYCNIIEKYASYFRSRGCRFYNICGDESGIEIEAYANFINKALSVIIKHDLTPMIFNDEICKNGMLDPYIINSTIVLSWTVKDGEPSPKLLEKCGYRQINCDYRHYYWTLGYSTSSNEWVERVRNRDVRIMTDNSLMQNIYGAMFCIWCDAANTDGADGGTAVVANTRDLILAFGDSLSRYDADGNMINCTLSGRPQIGINAGTSLFDKTLGKPIWYNGSAWVDYNGTVLN